MNDYLLLMHDDALGDEASWDWAAYFDRLRGSGAFQGGSTIGGGVCVARSKEPPAITPHLSGYIRIRAASLADARDLVRGNPVYETGGTVEIRELPRD